MDRAKKMSPEELEKYVSELEVLVTARTEQLRTEMVKVHELTAEIQRLRSSRSIPA